MWYWLPSPAQWQKRYLSTGGGGLAINSGEQGGLSNGLVYGAVAGLTDGGFGGFDNDLSTALLVANGTLNYEALFSFAYKGIHEMTVLGKALTTNFYGNQSFYSYYQGCSEGGREGLSQVQRYGTQFDGVAVGAPAMRQAFQQVLHLFSNVVENTIGYAPSPCELQRIANDTLKACDGLDGKTDGVVSRTDLCRLHYFANQSIGNSFSCAASASAGGPPGGSFSSSPAVNGTVSAKAAAIAQQIWDGIFDSKGRQVYISFPPSADFSDAATTYNSSTAKYEVAASGIGVQYINLFLNEVDSGTLSLDGVTYDTLRAWMLEGMQKFQDTLQTDWPDLEDFHNHGSKIIHFHGESDPSVPIDTSVIYHDAVRRTMYPNMTVNASYEALHGWYKLFLIPGAAHCSPNSEQPNGPFPQDVLQSVIDWVEHGLAPTRLRAQVLDSTSKSTGTNETICAFPLRPLWHNNSSSPSCEYDEASLGTWFPTIDSIPLPVY